MFTKKVLVSVMAMLLVAVSAGFAQAETGEVLLGSFLYFDKNLSSPAGQSCASCHLPTAGFADPDQNIPVSAGVVPGRFGTRNSPSAAYAAYSPDFFFNIEDGLWYGGQFWDGRAENLTAQAKGPFLNSSEMNNQTKDGVIKAVRKAIYAPLFKAVYGANSLNNVETAYNLVARAIAAFENSKAVNTFTSKYDYYLKGKVALTAQEARGLALFNDETKGKCALCHPSTSADGVTPPLFTDFSYDNLGIPVNPKIAALHGVASLPIDLGLGVTVGNSDENGKFKVSSLRNVAKTAPYGHNGYFKTLKQIVHFYNTRDVDSSWPAPEYAATVNHDELGNLGLTDKEENDIVAFLKTLSDYYTWW